MKTPKTLACVTFSVLVLAGCGGAADETEVLSATSGPDGGVAQTSSPAASPEAATTTEPHSQPSEQAGSQETFPYPVYELGEAFELGSTGLTVTSVSVESEIATRNGDVLTADESEELVIIETEYTNVGSEAVGLTCSGIPGILVAPTYNQGLAMRPLIEDDQFVDSECNYDGLSSGQQADWTTAYSMAQGGQPFALTFTGTRDVEGLVIVNLSDRPLGELHPCTFDPSVCQASD